MTSVLTSSKIAMNLPLLLLILTTFQENLGLSPLDNLNKTLIRSKRYATHLNPIYRHFDFLKRDECPPTLGGERRFFCPSKNENNEWMCVTLGQLCNTKPDCPEGEDENDTMCLFHRPVLAKLDDIATRLGNLHNLLSQQFNYMSHNDHYPVRANEIRERLQFEHYSRNPMLQEVPKPEIVPTLSQQLEEVENSENQQQQENEIESEDYETENEPEEMSFDELPQQAKQLILQQFRNRNPTHPFNRGRAQQYNPYSRGHNRGRGGPSGGHGHGGSLAANPTLSTEAALPTEKRKSWSNELMMLLV